MNTDDIAKPLIIAGITECVNYASWQNSVPLLRSLEIQNPTTETLTDLRLFLESSPSITRPKHWIIERLNPGESVQLRDRDVQLDPSYLNGLNEAERCIVNVRLLQGENLLAEAPHDIRVLARDEWGGMNSMGELLAAFVMPNDPALSSLLKLTGEILAKHGHSPALDGYQSNDPRRAYMLSAAIWSAVASKSLTYSNPPRSFEQVGQKTRRPAVVLSSGLATCLDSTLLFAAAIEAVGLNPVIVMIDGHCFVGVWLVEKTFSRLLETDCSEVRKAIAAKELVTFETTLITHRPPARFEDAIKAAHGATKELEDRKYIATIDIARARMAQIRPLASHDAQTSVVSQNVEPSGPLPLPAIPKLGSVASDESDEKPLTPEGRIERWQRKLLDLSLRNRLLNFKPNQQSIPLVCPNISLLEDRLAAGAQLRMISLKEQNPIGERDRELHRQKTNDDLDAEFARQSLERNEVSCAVTGTELTNRLTALYRSVRNDLSEGGSNTLFLAIGFLKWKKDPKDTQSYRAPLLLVPVKLLRKSALSPFHLALHDDEPRFNATLIQLLKKDFDRDISRFESTLPKDESGIDVPLILERMRSEVRDIPGFEVIDESALSTFSFAKYLMWKDLVDRVGQLENNRVVRHLIRSPDKPYESAFGSIPRPREVDKLFEPKEMFHPLPADSSQIAAIMAASQGQDFVLVGPPGTGKSQTIANIIAQCLALGKTVLFVAEKTAALDVVYRRLRERGLGDCCLELHSNKAERRKFLDQLETAWNNNRRADGNDWVSVSERLKLRRDELNAYVDAIHFKHPNGWTAFDALGISVKGGSSPTVGFDWPDTVQHDRPAYKAMERLVDELTLTYGAIDPQASLPMVKTTEWSASWEASLLSRSSKLSAATRSLRSSLTELSAAIGMPGTTDLSLAELDGLNQLAKALLLCAGHDVRILFHKEFTRFPSAVEELRRAIVSYNDARNSASANYDEMLESIPLEEIDLQWRKAAAAFWPMSWMAKRKVVRLLQSYASTGTAEPAKDIAAIRVIRQRLSSIGQSPLAGQSDHWNHHETDLDGLQAQLQKANELRQAMLAVGNLFGRQKEISKAVFPSLSGKASDSPLYKLANEFLDASQNYLVSLKSFGEAAGSLPVNQKTAAIINDSLTSMHQLATHRTHLQRWTAWRSLRKRATTAGIMPLIREVESGAIPIAELLNQFRLAYSRWWIPKIIDKSDALRTFQRFKHEDAIRDFCKLDEIAKSMASSRIRQSIAHNLPPSDGVPRQSELGTLRHQMNLTRPNKSIREVISAMPESFGKLAPCLLMSPLSIAQYLPVNQALFDVVIFDEASQITTWDAIGAIARGQQTIIVGDPKQLPPTNFFGRSDSDSENDELDEHEKDLESILDEAKASGLPTLMLNWHYRSRHESLIAFSNWHYYGNQLVTFPAAESNDRGVSLRYLPESVYDRGKSRTNRKEAEAIVRDAVSRMKRCLAMPEAQRLTFGVITFNSQQQSLIQDLFDQAQRENPELDWYFSDDRIEPTVVKNLENVQGDERDVMLFSITFGTDSTGRVPLTFGALNRDGGERRLNVAVTRARQELIVYSSFKADQLAAEGSKARGVRDLKNFLEYAEKGPIAIAARSEGSVGGFDSPFEEAVAERLAFKGWQVVPQVGVSGFRVDLGIVHPDKPGAYLAGVECDGATYHRSAVARDRDKIRQQILENLGWNIIRIWSPDWWYDCSRATELVDADLNSLLMRDRQRILVDTPEPEIEQSPIESTLVRPETEELDAPPTEPSQIVAAHERVADDDSRTYFYRAPLSDMSSHQDRFYDPSYDHELRSMAAEIILQEAPIRDDVLSKQIARAHGFARTGANIRSRVLAVLTDVTLTDESSGRFLWPASGPKPLIEFRFPKGEDSKRSVDEISIAELRGLIDANRHMMQESDPAIAFARSIGLARLSQSARERIEEAMSQDSQET